jgi:hypothetical protein
MERRTRLTKRAWGSIALQCVHPASGTGLGLHCKAMQKGVGAVHCLLHRFAMHGRSPPCNATSGPCPREAYGMQGPFSEASLGSGPWPCEACPLVGRRWPSNPSDGTGLGSDPFSETPNPCEACPREACEACPREACEAYKAL